jgi:nitric oxide reductase subunit B
MSGLYGGDPTLTPLRKAYAMSEVTVPDAARRGALTSFFFWTSWAATTERPGLSITYTNNWPHEPLVANHPSGANVLWSFVSVALLLAAIGALVWWTAFRGGEPKDPVPPTTDPFRGWRSRRRCGRWASIGTVIGLLVVQVGLGALTAHYTVEGQSLFGFPIGKWLPYSLTRTWHVQTGVFWIATAFLAAGLFLAPVIGGHEPKHQRLGVNVLFGALLLVVVGSLAGEYAAIHQVLPLDLSFWFGHQG